MAATSKAGLSPVGRHNLVQLLFDIRTVWVLLALFVPFVLAATTPLEGDIWRTLSSGRLMMQEGRFLTEYPFTFAPLATGIVNAQWLAQLAYFLAYRGLGLEGVTLFNALIFTATFGVLLIAAWQRCSSIRLAAASTLVAAVVASTNIGPRPQTLGFLLLALLSLTLAQRPLRFSGILVVAVVQALWANTHGSFVLGLALVGLLLAGEVFDIIFRAGWRVAGRAQQVRMLAFTLALQLVASMITPFGWDTVSSMWRVISDPVMATYLTVWWPTLMGDLTGQLFFGSLAVTVAALGYSVGTRRPIRAGDVLVAAAFAILALQAVRNVAWWALAMAPILAAWLAQPPLPSTLTGLGSRVPRPWAARAMSGVLLLLLTVGMISALPWVKAAHPLLSPARRDLIALGEPRAAARFLQEEPFPGHVFSVQSWGGYLEWTLWPQYRLMVDGWVEIHPAEVWLDYAAISNGQASWQDRLLGRTGSTTTGWT